MSNPWPTELWRLGAIVVLGLLLGLPFGLSWPLTALALGAYFVWHLMQLHRLERWLQQGSGYHPPEGHGVWGEVFHNIYQLQQRNRSRKRRLAGILSQYQKATSAMPDATVVVGAHWDIQWFNDAACRLLDFKASQDVGQRLDNLLRHPAFTAFLAKGAMGSVEFPSPANYRIMLSVRVVPFGDEQRLLIARDISEKQRLEQMRRDFVGNVSHELRTPLTVISGFLEQMAEEDGEHLRHWAPSLDLMRQQATRMQHLVEDLLLLSRIENDRHEPPREPVSVCAMAGIMAEDARLLSGNAKHVITTECDSAMELLGAERELYSAFYNLVTNAVRYTPAGGKIRLRWWSDESGGHFSVTDTGVGIAAEHLPRVTERFYRVDPGRSRETGGTGLGLAIVKHVLQRHDAKLRIDSMVGRGSTFTCDFPAERLVRGARAAAAGGG